MSITERLAQFVTSTSYGSISNEARTKAKECILDCTGCVVAGSVETISQPLLQYISAVGGENSATIIGIGTRTSVTNAALANGVLGHVLDFDDTNQIFIGHASVVIVPAIFALAEKHGFTGRDMITAYMAGTEVQWRLGEALVAAGDHYAKGWHSTGTIGTFGAVAAAGKLLGLDEGQLTHAFGIAASEAGGFQEQFGTHCKPFHAGRANEIGIRAAILAKAGFTSAKTALEGNVGYLKLVADRYDLSKITDFARPWGILEQSYGRGITLKAHPVCNSGTGAIEGVQSLVRQYDIKPDDVESIQCEVRPGAMNILMHHSPQTGLQAKFSVEYWVAKTLIDGHIGLEQITDEAVQDPRVQSLMRRIRVAGDPSIELATTHVKIAITTKDGRTLKEAYFPPRGGADNPMTLDELVRKFNDCAAWGKLSAAKAAQASELLLNLDNLQNARDLMRALVR